MLTWKTLFGSATRWFALLLACMASSAYAQLVEDIDWRRDGGDLVAQVRFSRPVQLQRSLQSRTGELLQVYYNLTSGGAAPAVEGERRTARSVGGLALSVSDIAVNVDTPLRRRLLVRLEQSYKIRVAAGRTKETIDIVFIGMGETAQGDELVQPAKTTKTPPAPAAASAAANAAKASAAKASAAKATATAPAAATAAPTSTPDVASTESQPQAELLMRQAAAASDRGEFDQAVQALDAVLVLPSNRYTRQAQLDIGLARLQMGDKQRARSEFETFIKLYPDGADSDRARQYLANLPVTEEQAPQRKTASEQTVVSGSLSAFYYGGKSQTRSQDFAESPLTGLPVLQSQSDISGTDQSQMQYNLDLNWRHRNAEVDQRFVLRDNYTQDYQPNRPNKNRLSALYFDNRSLTGGLSYRVGRQSPTGGGVLYRFDGVQLAYPIAPKYKISVATGVPTDTLLDTHRSFYGAWLDADALTSHASGSFYVNQQIIDSQTDRRAFGTELRYFNGGTTMMGQLDYDQLFHGLNIASLQGTQQYSDNSMLNFMLDRRAVPIRSLSNVLFFQDPNLTTPARTMGDLLASNSLDALQTQVNAITPFQNQAMLGYTTPLNERWQTGGTLNYTNVDAIEPVAVILPTGQASTGDLWSVGWQLIGSNLYSVRDTHVFSVNYLTGPTYHGVMMGYNNLSGLGEQWQLEPSLRLYSQSDTSGNQTRRWTPGLRVSYKVVKRLSMESELTAEYSDVNGPTRTETSQRTFYYLGGRFEL